MIKTVDATLIEWPFFVRRSLNEDHVIYLAELYDQKIEIPPIKVYKNEDKYIGVDGRHRYTAQVSLLERDKIKVEIVPKKEESELIFEAFQANLGGPLPPTRQDIQHTLELLMSKKSKAHIYNMFCPKYYDRATIKRYMDSIQSNQYKRKVSDAKRSVIEGNSTIAKAAELFGCDENDLKNALGGRKKGYKTNITAQYKQTLTQINRSASQRHQGLIRQAINNYEDGLISIEDIFDIIYQIEKYGKGIHHNVVNWKNRVEELVKTHGELSNEESNNR